MVGSYASCTIKLPRPSAPTGYVGTLDTAGGCSTVPSRANGEQGQILDRAAWSAARVDQEQRRVHHLRGIHDHKTAAAMPMNVLRSVALSTRICFSVGFGASNANVPAAAKSTEVMSAASLWALYQRPVSPPPPAARGQQCD